MAFLDVRHFAETHASFSPDGITLDTYTDDIEAVRRKLGFQQLVVIGHSHNGNLSLEYAKRFPSRVSHVVLIGSPARGKPDNRGGRCVLGRPCVGAAKGGSAA